MPLEAVFTLVRVALAAPTVATEGTTALQRNSAVMEWIPDSSGN